MAAEWIEVNLGDFAPFIYGRALPERTRDASGSFPVYGSNGVVGFHNTPLTKGPTLIVGRKGTVGAVQYSPIPCWPIDTTFYVTCAEASQVRFRYYLLKSLGLEHMNSDSAVPGLNREAAHGRRIRIPAGECQQHAIASVLGALDDKIDLNRRMNETLEAMARAIFKDWFVDFGPTRAKMEGRAPYLGPDIWSLFPDRLDEEGKPEGWNVRRVEDILELAYGKALKASERVDGPVPVYGSGGVTGYHNESLVEGPSVIVGRKGTVGVIYWEDRPFFPIDTVFYVRPKVELTFCYYHLQTLGLETMNTDAAVPGLNRNNVYRLSVPWSGDELRTQFDRRAAPLRQRIRANSEEIQTLSATRDFLLPKLMSGEVRVKDAEKIVGEAT